LLHRRTGQAHPEENRDGHEEEDHNSKKMVLKKIITGNKGAKGPTVMETDERMQEI